MTARGAGVAPLRYSLQVDIAKAFLRLHLSDSTRDLLIMVEFDANVGLHDGSDAGARAWLEDLRPAGCEALMSPRVPTNRVCPRRGGVGAVRREEVRRAADHTNRSAEGGA